MTFKKNRETTMVRCGMCQMGLETNIKARKTVFKNALSKYDREKRVSHSKDNQLVI